MVDLTSGSWGKKELRSERSPSPNKLEDVGLPFVMMLRDR